MGGETRPAVQCDLPGGVSVRALYDTGAGVSVISEDIFRAIPVNSRPQRCDAPQIKLTGVDGRPLDVRGCFNVPISLLDKSLSHRFYVARGLTSPVILGVDFMRLFGLSYDAIAHSLFFQEGQTWSTASIVAAEQLTLPARSTVRVPVAMMSRPGLPVIGPTSAVASIDCSLVPVMAQDALIHVDDKGLSSLILDNVTDVDIFIPQHTYLGVGDKVDDFHVAEVQVDWARQPDSTPPLGTACEDKDKLSYLLSSITDQVKDLSEDLKKRYAELIEKNHDIFSKDKFDLGRTSIMEHSVRLRDREPVFRKQFRIPEAHRSVLLEHLNNWLKLGVVSPCKSGYNSPIFLVPKKDGSLRPVLDFRAVNEKSLVDKYAQREVADCIDALGRSGSRVFSGLDLTAGFWQLPLEEESRPYTAFSIPGEGQFWWNCCPMGLLGSPASFGRLMDFVMKGLNAITYQDDVLIHSPDHYAHLADLQRAFDRIRAHGLKLNVSKCSFGQREISYLGFTLTESGLLPGKEKTKAILDFPPPESVRQVKEFCGIANYFRASIPNFASLAKPLHNLTSKESGWSGGPLPSAALDAFEKVKKALLEPPVLVYPDPEKQYHLLVDAAVGNEQTAGGLGACLVQFDDQGVPRAIGYASRGLKSYEKNYTAYLLELQAACFGISHFDTYLKGKRFVLYTDHKPLTRLSSAHTRTLNRLQQLMLDYDFMIQYIPGRDHPVPDFLSRNPISAIDIQGDQLRDLQESDPLVGRLIADLRADSVDPKFRRLAKNLVLKSGILFYSQDGLLKIFAPEAIRQQILEASHNSLMAGHMGLFKTKNRVLEKYFWPSLAKDVELHIHNCDVCQRMRIYHKEPRQPLVPLPATTMPNHRVHIDLFGPLQVSSNGKKYVMVMTDSFSKYTELAAISAKDAREVAKTLMDVWITRYSTPQEIISDNGKEFANKIMKELCSQLGILHNTTSPYHPQCNGQAEHFNKTMIRYLRSCLEPPYLDWELYLPALRISYNTSVSKATKATPFSLVFGMPANMPFYEWELDKRVNYDDDALLELERLKLARQKAAENNIEYRKNYAKYYNRRFKVADSQIQAGDFVYVKCPPDQKYKNPKFHPLYQGPFEVDRVKLPNIWYSVGKKGTRVTHVDRVKLALDPPPSTGIPPGAPPVAPAPFSPTQNFVSLPAPGAPAVAPRPFAGTNTIQLPILPERSPSPSQPSASGPGVAVNPDGFPCLSGSPQMYRPGVSWSPSVLADESVAIPPDTPWPATPHFGSRRDAHALSDSGSEAGEPIPLDFSADSDPAAPGSDLVDNQLADALADTSMADQDVHMRTLGPDWPPLDPAGGAKRKRSPEKPDMASAPDVPSILRPAKRLTSAASSWFDRLTSPPRTRSAGPVSDEPLVPRLPLESKWNKRSDKSKSTVAPDRSSPSDHHVPP